MNVVVVLLVVVVVAAGVAVRRLNKVPRGWLPSLPNLRASPEPGVAGVVWLGCLGGVGRVLWVGGVKREFFQFALTPPLDV